jgi:hypothetical protein
MPKGKKPEPLPQATLEKHNPKSVAISKRSKVPKKVGQSQLIRENLNIIAGVHGDCIRNSGDPHFKPQVDLFNWTLDRLAKFPAELVSKRASKAYDSWRSHWIRKNGSLDIGNEAELALLDRIATHGLKDIKPKKKFVIPDTLHGRLVLMFQMFLDHGTQASQGKYEKVCHLVGTNYTGEDVDKAEKAYLEDPESGINGVVQKYHAKLFTKDLKRRIKNGTRFPKNRVI